FPLRKVYSTAQGNKPRSWTIAMKTADRLIKAALLLCMAVPYFSQTGVGPSNPDLAQRPADPTVPLMSFNLKDEPTSNFFGGPSSGDAFVFQRAIPFRAWGQSDQLRATINYATSGPVGRGLDAVSVFDLIVSNQKLRRWRLDPLVQFPPNLGQG